MVKKNNLKESKEIKMQTHFLNETTVRTSVNYGINNIKVDFDLPDESKQRTFENFSISTDEIDKMDIKILDKGNQINEKNVGENKTYSEKNNETSENGDGKLSSKIGLSFQKYKKIVINIPENTEIKNAVLLDFLFNEDNSYLIDNIKINVGKNAKANFIIHYYSDNYILSEGDLDSNDYSKNIKNNIINTENANFHNLLLETNIEDNGECNIICANLLDDNANSFLAFENVLNENAKLVHTIVDLGGKNKISNYCSKLVGDCSFNNIKNIYLGAKNDIIDINYNIEAIGKNTKCIIESQGAIKDSAKKNFKGIIDFKEGSTKSIGKENENCLILSEKARSKSLPVLLCHEEDVNGEHGVSSGKPDKQKMFYIMSKGISYSDARKLLVKANFNNILDDIKNVSLNTEINDRINNMID